MDKKFEDLFAAIAHGDDEHRKWLYDAMKKFEEEYSQSREFESGAKRDSNRNKPFVHNLKGYMRLRFGYHMNVGARTYGDSNWEKGMPTESYLESIDRHLAKYKYNLENNLPQDEDHLSAMIFGCQGCMINEEKSGIKVDHYFKPIE